MPALHPFSVSTYRSLFFGSLLVLGACTVGDTGSGDDGTTDDNGTTPDASTGGGLDASEVPKVTATSTPSAQNIELYTTGAVVDVPTSQAVEDILEAINAKNRFAISLSSEGGFTGPVTLAVTGLGTGWAATFDPASVTLTDGGTATSTLRLTVDGQGEVGTKALTITATSSAGDEVMNASVTTTNQVTVGDQVLPLPEVTIKSGTVFRVRNDGTQMHVIHGDGAVVIHEPDPGHAPGEFYVSPLVVGNGTWGGHQFNGDPADGGGNYTMLHVLP